MQKSFVLFLLLSVFFWSSCGPVQGADEPNPRFKEKTREGNIDGDETDTETITDDPDTILGKIGETLKGFFKNIKDCESSVPHLPRSNYDLFFSFIGKVNPGAQLRECMVQRTEEASEVLCQGQRDLDTLLAKYRGYDERERRIEHAYQSALRSEREFRNNLLEYADKMRDQADRTSKDYFKEEYNALADALYLEADLTCRSRYYDSRSRRD